MITGYLITLGFLVLEYFIDLLPDAATIDESPWSAISNVIDVLYLWDWLVPSTLILSLLILGVIFWGSILFFRVMRWLVQFSFRRG